MTLWGIDVTRFALGCAVGLLLGGGIMWRAMR